MIEKKYDPGKALEEAIDSYANMSAGYWFKRFTKFNVAGFMNSRENEIKAENADEVLEIVKMVKETFKNKKLLMGIKPVLDKMEAIAMCAKGENVKLNYRVQTSSEYNPQLSDEILEKELFEKIIRRIPWYTKAYLTAKW